jgi:hypothetical protein
MRGIKVLAVVGLAVSAGSSAQRWSPRMLSRARGLNRPIDGKCSTRRPRQTPDGIDNAK